MALEDDMAMLSRAALFNLLDRDALRLLAFAAELRVLRAGDVLFRKGDRSDGGYVVIQGTILLDPRPGSTVPPVAAGPGTLIGRAALLVRSARPATAVARVPSTVMRISPTLMRRVLEEFPAAAEAMRDELAADLGDLAEGLAAVRPRFVA